MFKTVFIKKNERGLLMERGDFVRVLESGEHRLSLNPFKRQTVKNVTADSEFTDEAMLNYLQKNEAALAAALSVCVRIKRPGSGLVVR